MANEAKHTPGPWTAIADMVVQRGNHIDREICRCTSGLAMVDDANARLIAAAPETAAERDRLREVNAELLAALQAICNAQPDLELYRCIDAARAVIVKATGQGGLTS